MPICLAYLAQALSQRVLFPARGSQLLEKNVWLMMLTDIGEVVAVETTFLEVERAFEMSADDCERTMA